MIVKDEARAIVRTLESVVGVADVWCVLDTGSTDETVDVVRDFFEDRGLVGECVEGEFGDYASARNRTLDLTGAFEFLPKWALSMSADEVLHGGDKLRSFLASYEGEETAVLVEVRTPQGALDYPRVLRVGGPWRYENEVHEEPVHQTERDRRPVVKIEGCWIEYAPTDPERFAKRLRERDVPLLERQLARTTDPVARARVCILLAQTREQVALSIEDVAASSQEWFSALGWYAYLSMTEDGVPAEARRYARWKYLNVAELLGLYKPSEMVQRLQFAARDDAKNPALAYMLARHTADIDGEGRVRGNAREGLAAAQRAAKVAAEAVGDPENPHDPHGLLWHSHFIAAVCAKALGHGPAVKKAAEAGIAGGGSKELFAQFLK